MKTFQKRQFVIFIVLIISLIGFKGLSQVTDSDIVNSIIGKKFFEVNTKLDSLGVWYHMHITEEVKTGQIIYSISDGKGSVKVFTLKLLDDKIVEEIIINFRHDSREQVEDATKVEGQSGFHVGKYSTDIVFRWKK